MNTKQHETQRSWCFTCYISGVFKCYERQPRQKNDIETKQTNSVYMFVFPEDLIDS